MKSHSIGTMSRNTAMLMRRVCFGRMDLMGMGVLRPGGLWSLWGCSYGEASENRPAGDPPLSKGDHCTPVFYTTLTGLGSTRQATLLKPGPRKAGPEPGDRMSYLTQFTLSFQQGFRDSFLPWQKADTQRWDTYKLPCSSCVVGRPYSHTETNVPSLQNEVCPGCVCSLGTDEE